MKMRNFYYSEFLATTAAFLTFNRVVFNSVYSVKLYRQIVPLTKSNCRCR